MGMPFKNREIPPLIDDDTPVSGYGLIDWSYYANKSFFSWFKKDISNLAVDTPGLFANKPESIANILFERILHSIGMLKGYLFDLNAYVVAMDSKSEFRCRFFPEYKLHRKSQFTPEILELKRTTFSHLDKLIIEYGKDNGWITLRVPGYEADDIIYVLSKYILIDDHTHILCNDRDLYQLINKRVSIITEKAGSVVHYTANNFNEISGFSIGSTKIPPYDSPADFLLAKIIAGDDSDNISGYPKIGHKTAWSLVKKYKTFKNMMEGRAVDSTINVRGEEKVLLEMRKVGKEIFLRNLKLIDLSHVCENVQFKQRCIDIFNSQV